jgi:hypothetical protein
VGLLGETRSPENQQPRGSCPGAPAPGNPGGEVGGAGREGEVGENMLWPLLLAPGRHHPHLSPGGWATALNSFAQSREGREVSALCLPGALEGALCWEPGLGLAAAHLYILGPCLPLSCDSVLSELDRDCISLYPATMLCT